MGSHEGRGPGGSFTCVPSLRAPPFHPPGFLPHQEDFDNPFPDLNANIHHKIRSWALLRKSCGGPRPAGLSCEPEITGHSIKKLSLYDE